MKTGYHRDLEKLKKNQYLAQKVDFEKIGRLFTDDISKHIYFKNLLFSFGEEGDFASLRSDYPAYFHKEVVLKLSLREKYIFINAGAAGNGEMNNISRLGLLKNLDKAVLFEPDDAEMAHLKEYPFPDGAIDKIVFEKKGLADRNEKFSFSIGTLFKKSGKVDPEGNASISCVRLDDYLKECGNGRVDFLKMDVEGVEKKLLVGATDCILRDRPVLAVSIYHSLDDYFNLPLYIDQHFKYSHYYIGYHPSVDQLKDINRKRILAEIILYCLP